MCDELREREQIICAAICTVMILIILAVIGYCFVTDVQAGERSWKSKHITVTATAYCLCKKCTGKEPHDGKTATSHNAYDPGIAVDPKVIPYGARIDCAEYSRKPTWAEADDCSESKEKGGKIIGNHIDLRMTDHETAINFGRKKVTIRVWTEE